MLSLNPWPSGCRLNRKGFNSRQGLWILSCEDVNQLAYKMLMVLLRCLLMPEIMIHGVGTQGLPPPESLSCYITFTVFVHCKTQPKKKKECTLMSRSLSL